MPRTIIFPDLHLGSHDSAALRVALKTARLFKPHEVVILGDWLDAHDWSSHPVSDRRDLKAQGYQEEIEQCRKILAFLEALPSVNHIIYIEGNHEHRVERWAASQKGPWLGVVDSILPRVALSEGRRKKFTWVPYKEADVSSHYMVAAGLIAIHGWSTAKHSAAAHLERARGLSVIHGHTHRRQTYAHRHPISGDLLQGHSAGCLAKLQPLWVNQPTDWAHGFSLLYSRGDFWTLNNVSIVNGRTLLPDGREVVAGKEGSVIAGVA